MHTHVDMPHPQIAWTPCSKAKTKPKPKHNFTKQNLTIKNFEPTGSAKNVGVIDQQAIHHLTMYLTTKLNIPYPNI